MGSLFVLATAMAMLLTVENALNQIWEVKRGRPFLKRVGLYLLFGHRTTSSGSEPVGDVVCAERVDGPDRNRTAVG